MVMVVMDKDGNLPVFLSSLAWGSSVMGYTVREGASSPILPGLVFAEGEGKIRFKVLSSRMRTGIGYNLIINRFSFVFLSIDKLVTFG